MISLGQNTEKKTVRKGGYQSRGTWSTGAALVFPSTERETVDPVTLKQKQAQSLLRWWLWLFSPSFLLQPFSGHRPSESYKANRVVWTRAGVRLNTGCCDVCVEWATVSGGHSWYWARGAIFFLTGWDVLRGWVPHPKAHLLSHDNQTNGFYHSSHWPLTPELWAAL